MRFTTGNYHITTTPKAEWLIVIDSDSTIADMRHGRRIPDIKVMSQSKLALDAGLQHFEVIAVVLYTGPMVQIIIFYFF
jgi:hypothetical protein